VVVAAEGRRERCSVTKNEEEVQLEKNKPKPKQVPAISVNSLDGPFILIATNYVSHFAHWYSCEGDKRHGLD
jgi:hypothetical protein